MKTLGWFLLVVGSAACAKATDAQVVERDPVGPIRCYLVADSAGLTSSWAQLLCAGAPSDAPARCFQAADAGNQLSESQSIALCYGATSTAPADCAKQRAAENRLSNQSIINECSARGAGIARSSDVIACLVQGRASLQLSDYEIRELCAPGSAMYGDFF